MQNILDIDTVALNKEEDAVVIIDQTRLPGEIVLKELNKAEDMFNAIYLLEVRGAPAIGVFAALSMYVLSKEVNIEEPEDFRRWFERTCEYLNSSRPTAVNLSWALKQMSDLVFEKEGLKRSEILPYIRSLALKIRDDDIKVCRAIGEYGLTLLHKGDGVLTHCNAGKLATVRYGTATAPIYLAEEKGYHLRVFCDETRPLLQGARLTAFELTSAGIDTTLICDDMSGLVMKNGWINAVFVGCDRVAANGDTANKIGTSVVAAVAKRYDIPFYVCAPTSTIDMNTPSGSDIVIEERNPDEVTKMWYKERMAPEGVKVFNPAFDVTDHDLIKGFVTEYGIARAPFEKSFAEIFRIKKEKGR
jgi:methylthioribose-1-phosphate isomerase